MPLSCGEGVSCLYGLLVIPTVWADGISHSVGAHKYASVGSVGDIGRVGEGEDEVARAAKFRCAGYIHVGGDDVLLEGGNHLAHRCGHVEIAVVGAQGEHGQTAYGSELGSVIEHSGVVARGAVAILECEAYFQLGVSKCACPYGEGYEKDSFHGVFFCFYSQRYELSRAQANFLCVFLWRSGLQLLALLGERHDCIL